MSVRFRENIDLKYSSGSSGDSGNDEECEEEGMDLVPLTDFDGSNFIEKGNICAQQEEESLRNANISRERIRTLWKLACRKAYARSQNVDSDPWGDFSLEHIEVEVGLRHRYNAVRKSWKCDEITVKLESQPFARGAMRECYRMKKLTKSSKNADWQHASNYVAKLYMEKVDRDIIFEDVKLQMDSKLWGEEYNRHNPPKKIDVFQMSILEFKNRPGSPLFHLEHFIEGDYIKYNSNSGFVNDVQRLTPQAFSHFTFERSGHKLMVVDIQGVGNLYTDPQIHTAKGREYGDGNLGVKGMALFFYSHICNTICDHLGLGAFDLSPSEEDKHDKVMNEIQSCASTVSKGEEELVCIPRPRYSIDMTDFVIRRRDLSSQSSIDSSYGSIPEGELLSSPTSTSNYHLRNNRRVRVHTDSDSGSMTQEEELSAFAAQANQLHRPSCVNLEVQLRSLLTSGKKTGGSVLGQIHLEVAKYHEIGRFCPKDETPDMEAAMFHLKQAADCGILEAILAIARIYLQLPNDVLPGIHVKESNDTLNEGMDYMLLAAEAGDRSAMIYVAKAFDTGIGIGSKRSRSWEDAVHWYDTTLNTATEDEDEQFNSTTETSNYQLLARLAEMFLEGGFGLEKFPEKSGDLFNEAAELAMEAMKGRLANKYYAMSEEAYAQMTEEDPSY